MKPSNDNQNHNGYSRSPSPLWAIYLKGHCKKDFLNDGNQYFVLPSRNLTTWSLFWRECQVSRGAHQCVKYYLHQNRASTILSGPRYAHTAATSKSVCRMLAEAHTDRH